MRLIQNMQMKELEMKELEMNECQICYEKNKIELECGHRLCLDCCIKHFRRNESCPYCRKMMYPNEDRTKEFEHAIYDEMECEYTYDEEKPMSMYTYLKSKGVKRKDRAEIIDSIVDRCLEVCKLMQTYTSYEYSDSDDSDYETVSDDSLSESETLIDSKKVKNEKAI